MILPRRPVGRLTVVATVLATAAAIAAGPARATPDGTPSAAPPGRRWCGRSIRSSGATPTT
ncbi:hypothetical protein ACFQ10_46130 [Streptomyces indonesiensis]